MLHLPTTLFTAFLLVVFAFTGDESSTSIRFVQSLTGADKPSSQQDSSVDARAIAVAAAASINCVTPSVAALAQSGRVPASTLAATQASGLAANAGATGQVRYSYALGAFVSAPPTASAP